MPYRKRGYRKVHHRPKGRKLNRRERIEVKRLIAQPAEQKVCDTIYNGVLPSVASPAISAVALPVQGDGYDQRDGDHINLKMLEYKYNINVGDTTNIVRHIVFKWGDDNSVTVPTSADIFQNTTYAVWQSPLNYQNLQNKKLKVLYDKTYALSEQGHVAQTGTKQIHFKLYGRRLHGNRLRFNQGATNGTGMLYDCFISDSGFSPYPAVWGFCRLTFTP